MAGPTLSDITAVLNLIFLDGMASQIRRDVLLPNLVPVVNDRNDSCHWKAKFDARSTASAKAEGHTPADGDFSTHTRKKLSLDWAEYFGYAEVTGLAKAIDARDGGGSLLSEEVLDALDELAILVSSDSYAGDETASPIELGGLAIAVDAADTYAGLTVAAESNHASPEDTLAAASLSISNIRAKLIRPFKDSCGFYPDMVMCPGDVFDSIGDLFGSERRYVKTVSTVRGQIDLDKLSGGFRALEIDGVPIFEDRHCTASTMYALHSRYLSYRQVPDYADNLDPSIVIPAFKALTGQSLEQGTVESMIKAGGSRIQPTIEALAKTGDFLRVMVKWYGQLRLTRRNAAAKLTLT